MSGIELWAIAALGDSGDGCDGYILRTSHDAKQCDLFPNGASLEDAGLDSEWHKGKPAGVYMLRLNPWSHQTMPEGEWDTGIDVVACEELYRLPPKKESY